jgi:hypothetical protein
LTLLECRSGRACHSGVTAHSTPIEPRTAARHWAPTAWIVAAGLAIGGIAGAGSLADDDGYSAGPGGRLAVQDADAVRR